MRIRKGAVSKKGHKKGLFAFQSFRPLKIALKLIWRISEEVFFEHKLRVLFSPLKPKVIWRRLDRGWLPPSLNMDMFQLFYENSWISYVQILKNT
jgi:hypothetical protein